MGIFKDLFAAKDNPQPSFWKPITTPEDIESAKEESQHRKVAIFKHSTRCFISKTVLKNFENQIQSANPDVAFYFLDLIQYRSLSNQIAEEFNVPHQSPQLIILKGGKAIKDFSHQAIDLAQV